MIKKRIIEEEFSHQIKGIQKQYMKAQINLDYLETWCKCFENNNCILKIIPDYSELLIHNHYHEIVLYITKFFSKDTTAISINKVLLYLENNMKKLYPNFNEKSKRNYKEKLGKIIEEYNVIINSDDYLKIRNMRDKEIAHEDKKIEEHLNLELLESFINKMYYMIDSIFKLLETSYEKYIFRNDLETLISKY